MIPTNLTEANELILRVISEADDAMVLGFLPLTLAQEDAVLEHVKKAVNASSVASITGLLRIAPAATAYALAVAPSRSLTTGGKFWPSLESDLGVFMLAPSRPVFSTQFRSSCALLGLLAGTLEETGFTHAAPFIFQSGILHYWIHSLATGLRQTLRNIPAPDLESDMALTAFVTQLANQIHGQPLLLSTLKTDVGPLLVRRLITAYISQDWSVLPPHLQTPIREAFEETGKGIVLKSPYLKFVPAYGEIEVILPGQSERITSGDTFWRIDDRKYAARIEKQIPLSELRERRFGVELCQLDGFKNQSFLLDARLDDDVPFRVFRKDTGRERRSDAGQDAKLPPGEYFVLMAPDVETNDEDNMKEQRGFRELEIEMRPGNDPLILKRGGNRWEIRAELHQGVYLDRDRAQAVSIKGGGLLHYGDDLGLIAYFPATASGNGSFRLEVCCAGQKLEMRHEISAPETGAGVYTFHTNLQSPIAAALAQLQPGIHWLEISLSHPTACVRYSLWYWKGLQRISESLGFKCTEAPRNVNPHGCRGLVVNEKGIAFKSGYYAPTVTLALTEPYNTIIRLPRAGVQVVVLEPESDWEFEPKPEIPLIVKSNDRRVLRFHSGGFQRWEILGNDKKIVTLDRNRISQVNTLAGLASELGGSGRIFARGEDGELIPLVSFTRPLSASTPEHKTEDGRGCERWSFSVPAVELFGIGAVITDLSDDPCSDAGVIEVLAERVEKGFVFQKIIFGENLITLKANSSVPVNHWKDSIATALEAAANTNTTAQKKDEERLNVMIEILTTSLGSGLWAIDFFRRTAENGEWLPLDCVEAHGYSTLRFFAWGPDPLPNDAGWWRRLMRAGKPRETELRDSPLAVALAGMGPEDLNSALGQCRKLLGWKYPSTVWNENARRVQDFPVHLGCHQFSIWGPAGGIWWRHAACELSDYAAVAAAPVTRQFLLGSQPDCFRLPGEAMVIGEGEQFSSPVGRSMNLPAEIHAAGSLKDYVVPQFLRGELDQDIVLSFGNYLAVQTRKDDDFRDFSLRTFLCGESGFVKGLTERTKELDESNPRYEVTALLSPEHLHYSIRALKRRCLTIEQASREEEHPLSSVAQSIERIFQRLEIVAPNIAPMIGWKGMGEFVWTPPLLENPWAEKVAQLVWVVAAISRLAANGKISPKDFENYLQRLLCRNTPTKRKIQNRLCILLSLAPELLTFYLALFELLFPKTNNK